jgi:hypothetical protein
MRALFQRIGAWTNRHAFACRLIGLAAVVALTAALSVSAERQREKFQSVFSHPMREIFRKANFWRVDDDFMEARREAMQRAVAQRKLHPESPNDAE